MLKIELHKNHKSFLGICAAVLVASAGGSYYVWQECEELDLHSQGLEREVMTSKGKIAMVEDLEKDVIILRENLQEYVKILPNDNEVNDFYRDLSEFAQQSHVRITKLTPKIERQNLRNSKAFEQATYTLKFEATFDQFLQFINRLENHARFVSVGSIKLTAADKDSEELQPLHSCDIVVLTYVYRGDDAGSQVDIVNFDRKVALLAEQISEARHEMSLEKYQYIVEGIRRDPMVDPRHRELVSADGSTGVQRDPQEQRALVDEALSTIEELDALFGLMQRAGSVMREMELRVEGWNRLAELQARIDVAIVNGEISDPNLKREFEGMVLPELARLRKQFGSEEMGGEDRDRIRIENALGQMRRSYEDHDYEAVVKAYEVVNQIVSQISDPDLIPIQEEMDALYLNATTAISFQDVELNVSGLVMYPARESVAVINEVVYREGEAVNQELFLVEIFEDRLIFDYRGVLLTYDL